MKTRCLVLAAVLVALVPTAHARPSRTLAERLGYAPDARLLVVHADDLGVSHSVDAASIRALETGLVSSASIMVPCPWFPEIAAWAKAHPDMDLGLHLTLTSEWASYKWGPVLPADRVKSLVGPDGYLYPTEDVAASKIDPKDAEAEIRAQIDRALAFGVNVTHLDSHMGTLYQNRALVDVFVRVARDYKLPIRMSKEYFGPMPFLSSVIKPEDALFDHMVDATPLVPADKWGAWYADAIKAAGPGVTLVTIHLATDDEEMRAVTKDHPDWGSAWRQRDLDYFTSDAFRKLLDENGIELVTYRELAKAAAKGA